MIYTEEEIVSLARNRELPDTQEVEQRCFYWALRCLISEFQLGKLGKDEVDELKRKVTMAFRQDEKVGLFRKSQLHELADAWCKVENLVEEYNHHKSLATADKILECLYPTNGEVIE